MTVKKKKLSEMTDDELMKLSPEERAELEELELSDDDEEFETETEDDLDESESDSGDDEEEEDEEGEDGEDESDDEGLSDEELEKLRSKPKDDPVWRIEREKRKKAQAENKELLARLEKLETQNSAFEKIMQEATKAAEDDDDIEITDDMEIDDLMAVIDKKIAKASRPAEKEKEKRFKVVDEDALSPPRYVDPEGTDYSDDVKSGDITFRQGRVWEMVEDDRGYHFPVFDAKALHGVDVETVDIYGEAVFSQMWGSKQKPGPLAKWRADNFGEFLSVLNSESPPEGFFEKFIELRGNNKGKKRRVVVDDEEEIKGLGAGNRGGGGGNKKRKVKTIHEMSDAELMELDQEERDSLIDG